MNLESLAWISISLNATQCLLNATALRSLRCRSRREPDRASEGVDIVVPARNEETRIEATITAILEAGHVDGRLPEIFVVDDESSDATASLLRALAGRRRDPRLHVIRGASRPDSREWVGKNWACVQAASRGQGSWLVFLDADVALEPGALQAAIDIARARRSDLLSVIPRIQGTRLFERVIDPAFWGFGLLMLSARALGLLRGTALPSCTPGAFLVFRREAYERLGGHTAVAGDAVEDVALAQRVTRAGLRVDTCVRPDLAATPTPDWARVIHVGSGRRTMLSACGAITLLLTYSAPWLLAIVALRRADPHLVGLAASAIVAARANVGITSMAFGLRGHSIWLGFATGAVSAWVWLRAILASELGWQIRWKGRSVACDGGWPLAGRAPTAIVPPRHDVRAS